MTTCAYDADTSTRFSRMTPGVGSNNVNAGNPAAGSNSIKICSEPYAVDEIASGESAPSATGFDTFSDARLSVISGFPRKTRLAMSPMDAGICLLAEPPAEDVTTTFLSIPQQKLSADERL